MKTKYMIVWMMVAVLLAPLQVKAQAATWPDPEWEYENESIANAITVDSFRAQIKANALYFFAEHRLYIVDSTTGKQKAVIEYLKGSRFFYEFFGSYAQIGKDGSVYAYTAAKDAGGNDAYTLHAYSQTGQKLWEKSYSEKIRSLVGVNVLNDGSILAHLETGSEQYVSYRYDRQGKLLEKKTWNGAIIGYQNGHLVTVKIVSKEASRFSFYDDQMKLKFSHDIPFAQGLYAGVGPDGQLYRYQYNKEAGTTKYFAQDRAGKVIWSKVLKGEPGRDSLYDNHHPGMGSFTAGYAGSAGDTFFLFETGGTYRQLPYTDHYFQTASDGSLLLQQGGKLEIYQAPGLKRVHTVDVSHLRKGTAFLYVGKGIVYAISPQNVIQKLDLYNPPIRVYVNGEKQVFAVAPQNLQGTVMLPLRDSVEFLGGTVQWQGGDVVVSLGDNQVTMTVNDATAQVNGRSYTLNQPPILFRGYTMIPVRFMSEALGAQVTWSQQENSITIDQ